MTFVAFLLIFSQLFTVCEGCCCPEAQQTPPQQPPQHEAPKKDKSTRKKTKDKGDEDLEKEDAKMLENNKALEELQNEKQKERSDFELDYDAPVKGHGSQNLGNTCYMNALLQCLFHTKGYCNWLKSVNWEARLHVVEDVYKQAKQDYDSCQQGEGETDDVFTRRKDDLRKGRDKAKNKRDQVKLNICLRKLVQEYERMGNDVVSCMELVKNNEDKFPVFFKGYSQPNPEELPDPKENPEDHGEQTFNTDFWDGFFMFLNSIFYPAEQTKPRLGEKVNKNGGPQKRYSPKTEGFGVQHDAQELFLQLVDASTLYGVGDDIRHSNEYFHGFNGVLASIKTKSCLPNVAGPLLPACNAPRQRVDVEPFICMTDLNFFTNASDFDMLSDILDKSFRDNYHDDAYLDCEISGLRHTRLLEQPKIRDAPDYLVLHLVRFVQDFGEDVNEPRKISKKIVFPEFLDLSKFKMPNAGGVFRYRLYGIVCHSGTLRGGHYFALCRDSDEWFCYDDSRVSKISSLATVSDAVMNSLSANQQQIIPLNPLRRNKLYISKNAYMLFYVRSGVEGYLN